MIYSQFKYEPYVHASNIMFTHLTYGLSFREYRFTSIPRMSLFFFRGEKKEESVAVVVIAAAEGEKKRALY